MNIDDDGMESYIMGHIFYLSPLVLLNIMNGTCVDKCPTTTFFWSIQVVANNALVPIFNMKG